jgi:Zn-dependent M16 (insulinase) family peptidase
MGWMCAHLRRKHQAEAVAQTKRFLATLSEFPLVREEMDWRAEAGSREGIVIPSKVMYVGLGGNFRMLGEEYAPDLLVLKKYLTSVFLWDNIRILGGAYGALMSVDKTGNFLFVSYRDPKLKETIDVYRNVPETVQSLSVSEKDISKLIIGTISDVDAPQPVYTIGRKMLHDLYKNDDWELQQQNRAKILSVTAESLRALYPLAQKVIDQNNICAIGSERQLRRNETIFDKIYSVTRLDHEKKDLVILAILLLFSVFFTSNTFMPQVMIQFLFDMGTIVCELNSGDVIYRIIPIRDIIPEALPNC